MFPSILLKAESRKLKEKQGKLMMSRLVLDMVDKLIKM